MKILALLFIVCVFVKVVLFFVDAANVRKNIIADEEDMKYWENKYDGM